MQRVYKLEELGDVVGEFLESLTPSPSPGERGKVVGFSGNLGAGKTTFTKELLRQLGHVGSVASPTFVLRRDYSVPLLLKEGLGVVIHIDAYRLENPEHIYQVIGKEELADKNNLIIIEWPEKIPQELLSEIYEFEHVDENTRRLSKKVNNI